MMMPIGFDPHQPLSGAFEKFPKHLRLRAERICGYPFYLGPQEHQLGADVINNLTMGQVRRWFAEHGGREALRRTPECGPLMLKLLSERLAMNAGVVFLDDAGGGP